MRVTYIRVVTDGSLLPVTHVITLSASSFAHTEKLHGSGQSYLVALPVGSRAREPQQWLTVGRPLSR